MSQHGHLTAAADDDIGGTHFIVKVADPAVRRRRRVRSSVTTSRRASACSSPAAAAPVARTRLFATDTVPQRAMGIQSFSVLRRGRIRRRQQGANVDRRTTTAAAFVTSALFLGHVTSDVISWYRALAERR